MKTQIKSLFMKDDGTSDNKEVLIDYFLSWTLRCAVSDVEKDYPLLKKYSTKILSVLMYNNADIIKLDSIESVKTWKQSSRIDLWVEVEFKDGVKSAILIESKGYSKLHNDQLKRYREIFENHYKGREFFLYYCYFTLHEQVPEEDKEKCEEAGFCAFTMDDVYNKFMKGLDCEWTNNNLFDEFWFTCWG